MSKRPTSKPHETTTKPLTKPLDFYHTFHETGGFYKYYLYVRETFSSLERWFRRFVDKIRVVSWLVSWWFRGGFVIDGLRTPPVIDVKTSQNNLQLTCVKLFWSWWERIAQSPDVPTGPLSSQESYEEVRLVTTRTLGIYRGSWNRLSQRPQEAYQSEWQHVRACGSLHLRTTTMANS